MKRILFILLLTIPFIGFGQKFIEKKIQTSNGTIILYTDSIKLAIDIFFTQPKTVITLTIQETMSGLVLNQLT